jgi:hypothetical protein
VSGEDRPIVGIDPLDRFPGMPADIVLAVQGVHQSLTKSPALPPGINEVIEEAPESTAPLYKSKYPDRPSPPPGRSRRFGPAEVFYDPGAQRPIGSRKARR